MGDRRGLLDDLVEHSYGVFNGWGGVVWLQAAPLAFRRFYSSGADLQDMMMNCAG